MVTKLFVGSLSWNVNDEQLKEFFSSVGEVVSATVIKDRDSGRSKGFGFVEMASGEDAAVAIKQLDNKDLDGRAVNVSEAKPREPRSSQSSGGRSDRQSGGGRRY